MITEKQLKEIEEYLSLPREFKDIHVQRLIAEVRQLRAENEMLAAEVNHLRGPVNGDGYEPNNNPCGVCNGTGSICEKEGNAYIGKRCPNGCPGPKVKMP